MKDDTDVNITGTKWVAPLSDFDDHVEAMKVHNDRLYLAYLFFNSGSIALAGEFNGKTLKHHYQSWGSSFGFTRLRLFDDELYLVGGAGFYPVFKLVKEREDTWDDCWEDVVYDNTTYTDYLIHGNNKIGGTSISPFLRVKSGGDVSGEFDDDVNALIVYKDKIYAGGSFKTIDGKSIRGVAMWNGSSWEALGSGIDGSVKSMAVYKDKLVILGKFEKAGTDVVNNIVFGDESSFTGLGTGLTGGYNNVGDLCVFGYQLFVGGEFEEAGITFTKCR